jgi:hypothetical protein
LGGFNLVANKKNFALEVEKFHWCGIFYMVYKRGLPTPGDLIRAPKRKNQEHQNQHRTLQTNVKKKLLLNRGGWF